MKWLKGIKQLRVSKDLLDGLVSDIARGSNIGPEEEVANRIGKVQSALEEAKSYFLGEDK